MNISELQQQFDANIIRLKRAMEYMDGPASPEAKEKWRPEYIKLIYETSDLDLQLQQAKIVECNKD